VSDHESGKLTLAMTPVLPTSGNDNFIWSGQTINGQAGVDTVALRHGESIEHDQIAGKLKGMEVIDLSIGGANTITGGLSVADVVKITGSNNGALTIRGDGDDKVELSHNGEWSTTGEVTDGHVAYTNGSVTLLIDEHVKVDLPANGVMAEAPAPMSFAAFDHVESFGLASLRAPEPAKAVASDALSISIDDVFYPSTSGEDLTAGLPAEHRDSPASSGASGARPGDLDLGGGTFVPPLEDELRHGVHYGA